MARSRRGTWKLTRDEDNFAVTRFSSQSLKPGLRLFVLQPFTGKTHQLRVAMKSIGSPILGDTLYGGDEAEHLFLHAWRLVFDYLASISIFGLRLIKHGRLKSICRRVWVRMSPNRSSGVFVYIKKKAV